MELSQDEFDAIIMVLISIGIVIGVLILNNNMNEGE